MLPYHFVRIVIVTAIYFILFDVSAQKNRKSVSNDTIFQTCITVSPDMLKILQETKTGNYVVSNTVSLQNYNPLTQKTLNYLENHGYPFASIYLDSIFEKNDTVFAQLLIEKNLRCSFDTIAVRGNLKVAGSYLKAYFNFKNKKPYNESIVKQIPQLAREIPFADEQQPSVIEFTEEQATLYLFLNKKRVNQFDGYIGMAPVSNRSGKIAVYGEMNLHLMNLFTIGESIDVQWRAPERLSQFLELKANFPYLVGTPLGVDGLFMLDKKDTAFLNMNYTVGLFYSFKGYNFARVYFDYATSNILDKNLYTHSDNPTYSDYRKTMYGFAFRFRKLDFIYNPRKGYDLNLNIAVGTRKIIENYQAAPDYYENIDLLTIRYKMQGKIKGYIPLHKRWALGLSAEGGALLGKQHLLNELFRIGGMNSLQGFEDLSIRASSYGIGGIELRFLLAKIAYLNTFFNGAWYEQKITNNYLHDFPFGFGAGIAFTTKAGLFYLSYALGKQSGNPISFKTGKIHFGLAVQF
ncbi:MAG: BamA/TamA family outer membrane protein [Bacteroidetes bacterium]|nr:BamA/TamA family outer membrane protein [Bacteroidota bacterium]MCL1968034.1 BamA/TamA family outer membrane protein [Bacteroidota bacterium]